MLREVQFLYLSVLITSVKYSEWVEASNLVHIVKHTAPYSVDLSTNCIVNTLSSHEIKQRSDKCLELNQCYFIMQMIIVMVKTAMTVHL